MPFTRPGTGWPSARAAQTTGTPSAVTRSQSSMDSRSSLSVCMRTSLAALSDALRVGRARGDRLVHARDCVVQRDRVERRAEQVDALLTHSPSPSPRSRRSPRRAARRYARRRARPRARGSAPARLSRCSATLPAGEHRLAARAHDDVRPLLDRDRPLRRLPERHAGDAEHGRLLLDSARVGQHEARPRRAGRGSRGSRATAARWIPDSVEEPARGPKASIRASVRGWSGKTIGISGRDLFGRLEQSCEDPLVVDVLGAVQREEGVRRGDAEPLGRAPRARAASAERRSVSIIVLPTNSMRSSGDPLGHEVVARVAARREEVGRQVVAEAAVDLLRP